MRLLHFGTEPQRYCWDQLITRLVLTCGLLVVFSVAWYTNRRAMACGEFLRDWHVYPRWKAQNLARIVPSLGPDGVDLLSKKLQYDPADRISAKDQWIIPILIPSISLSSETSSSCW